MNVRQQKRDFKPLQASLPSLYVISNARRINVSSSPIMSSVTFLFMPLRNITPNPQDKSTVPMPENTNTPPGAKAHKRLFLMQCTMYTRQREKAKYKINPKSHSSRIVYKFDGTSFKLYADAEMPWFSG